MQIRRGRLRVLKGLKDHYSPGETGQKKKKKNVVANGVEGRDPDGMYLPFFPISSSVQHEVQTDVHT